MWPWPHWIEKRSLNRCEVSANHYVSFAGNSLNAASLSLDSWKVINDSDVLRELRVKKPLLESAVGVKKSIDELAKYMRPLPLYSADFLTMICNMVMQYKVRSI